MSGARPRLRGLDVIRGDLSIWSERAALAVEAISWGERDIRRGKRPATAFARVRSARAQLREARAWVASLRVELARAERWAAWRCPVQLDLWQEVA